MNTATHTAAPWQADSNGTIYAISPDGARQAVAAVSPDNQQADCALISAAPELLARLEEALDALEDSDEYPNTARRVRAAISKAKGNA